MILIIKTGALGDVVRTSYILPGLKKKYPDEPVAWLTGDGAYDLLKYNPFIDTLTPLSAKDEQLRSEPFRWIISLDDEKEILDFINTLEYRKITGAYAGSAGTSAYSEDAACWFDMGIISKFGKERADFLKKENRLSHTEILSSMLGIRIEQPAFYNSSAVEEAVKKRFPPGFFHIGLNSGAGGRWKSKELRIDQTVVLIERLLRLSMAGKPVKVHLLGGASEAERHGHIRRMISNDRLADAGNDNSLLEFAAIVKNMDYIVTSDSLALHLAISQSVPSTSFYAPTSAAEIDTFGTGVKVLSTSPDYCSYNVDADNSTITAERIYAVATEHIGKMQSNRRTGIDHEERQAHNILH